MPSYLAQEILNDLSRASDKGKVVTWLPEMSASLTRLTLSQFADSVNVASLNIDEELQKKLHAHFMAATELLRHFCTLCTRSRGSSPAESSCGT